MKKKKNIIKDLPKYLGYFKNETMVSFCKNYGSFFKDNSTLPILSSSKVDDHVQISILYTEKGSNDWDQKLNAFLSSHRDILADKNSKLLRNLERKLKIKLHKDSENQVTVECHDQGARYMFSWNKEHIDNESNIETELYLEFRVNTYLLCKAYLEKNNEVVLEKLEYFFNVPNGLLHKEKPEIANELPAEDIGDTRVDTGSEGYIDILIKYDTAKLIADLIEHLVPEYQTRLVEKYYEYFFSSTNAVISIADTLNNLRQFKKAEELVKKELENVQQYEKNKEQNEIALTVVLAEITSNQLNHTETVKHCLKVLEKRPEDKARLNILLYNLVFTKDDGRFIQMIDKLSNPLEKKIISQFFYYTNDWGKFKPDTIKLIVKELAATNRPQKPVVAKLYKLLVSVMDFAITHNSDTTTSLKHFEQDIMHLKSLGVPLKILCIKCINKGHLKLAQKLIQNAKESVVGDEIREIFKLKLYISQKYNEKLVEEIKESSLSDQDKAAIYHFGVEIFIAVKKFEHASRYLKLAMDNSLDNPELLCEIISTAKNLRSFITLEAGKALLDFALIIGAENLEALEKFEKENETIMNNSVNDEPPKEIIIVEDIHPEEQEHSSDSTDDEELRIELASIPTPEELHAYYTFKKAQFVQTNNIMFPHKGWTFKEKPIPFSKVTYAGEYKGLKYYSILSPDFKDEVRSQFEKCLTIAPRAKGVNGIKIYPCAIMVKNKHTNARPYTKEVLVNPDQELLLPFDKIKIHKGLEDIEVFKKKVLYSPKKLAYIDVPFCKHDDQKTEIIGDSDE